MPVTSYSTTAGNNNSAPPNGAPEGMAPSNVNNCIRQVMADLAVEAQTNAVKVLNTVAGTDTITADMNPELAAYAAGMMVIFTPANTNTGAVTLSIDGLTALDVQKGNHAALIAGDLIAGIPAMLVLDSGADDWILMNPQTVSDAATLDGIDSTGFAQISSGSFTGTLTGCTTSPTANFSYLKVNNVVVITLNASLSATSNTTLMTVTGLPAAITPSVSRMIPFSSLVDNTTNKTGIAVINTSNAIEFYLHQVSGSNITLGAFTSSGTKGLGILSGTPQWVYSL